MGPATEQRCTGCGELNPARAKFCLECGGVLRSTEPSGSVDLLDRLPQPTGSEGERRIVSVLFADLSGFTAYSEGSDVEDVRTIAQETAQRLGEIVQRYGGTVDKIIGDCVMAVWGAPIAHEDDPERAVRAAIDMQACVAENRERFAGLTLCVGMTTGEAMWSPVGPDGRYSVFGDTVNTAARLQGAAAKGEILIGLPTYEAVAAVVECEAIDPIKAKNKAEPVAAWRALSVKGERAAFRPVVAPLLGRDQELHRLQEIWERVRAERQTYGVTVLGSPGVGKSRLVKTFTDKVASDALVLRGRCLPYGEGITYWPVVEIVQQAADIRHDDDRETVSRKLGELLESLGTDDLDELRTIAVALANLIGAPTTPRGTYSATEISRAELHWGVRRIIELGARTTPLVLVFEDLHWAEPTLLELISFIFDSAEDAPVLGICTGRPELEEKGEVLLAPRTNRRVVHVETLTDDAARSVVTELLGTDGVPGSTVDDLIRSAGGNPLFLEEIAQMWRESGPDTRPARLPSGLQALIDSRLDQLPPVERRIVTHAAVVGEVFWTGTITYLEGAEDGVAEALASLESRDLIRSMPTTSLSGEREYGFKHGLIRDAAYRRLTKSERAQLHQRCGSWIAALPGGEEEFAEIFAYHLEQACRIASDLSLHDAAAPMLPAARALMRASERAEHREGMAEGERFLARAIELLGDAYAETAAELKHRRSRLLASLGRYDEAMSLMREVAGSAAELGRGDLECRALLSLAEVEVPMGDAAGATEHLGQVDALLREVQDPTLRVRAMWSRAALQEVSDGPAAAIETMLGAVALAEETADAETALNARLRLGAIYFNNGDLEPARVHFERCLELAGQRGSLRHQSWLTAFMGLIRHHCGPREECDPLFARAADWMERTDDRYMHVQALVWRGASHLSTDPQLALKLLREADRQGRTVGGALAVLAVRYLTEALARQGRTVEAREFVAAVRDEPLDGDPLSQANLHIAEAFAASSDHATGRRYFAQAIPLLESQGTMIDLGDARVAYARFLEASGDLTGATDQFERALVLFEGVGAAATAREIELELARIRDAELTASDSATPLGNA